jgi:predicted DCC family thiol-disulfide oxidoreductase YuxK
MTRLTVWYDQSCPLCRREINLMRRLDRGGRIQFVDAADPSTTCPLDRAEVLSRFHAMENGHLLSGAAAFAAMWRAIPLLWPLGMAARLPGAERLLNWAYGHFLKIRPCLQRFFA